MKNKTWYIAIILLFSFKVLLLNAQVDLQIQPSCTTGAAPLYIFFDATNTTGLDSANDLVNSDFHWDFDINDTDPDGNWETTKGMVAGHVFEVAGTYTVQCRVTSPDGSVDTETIIITVSDFSGITYYVSATGNDANDGLSESTPWQTANYAFSQLSTNTRILFNRGDTFTNVAYHFQNLAGGKIIIGAYGTGNKPILSGTVDEDRMLQLDFVDNIAFVNLHVVVNAPSVFGGNLDIEDSSNILLLDLELEGSTSRAVLNNDCNLVGVFDTYIHDFGVLATFAGNGTRLSWVGNTIDNLIGTPQPEHGMRIQGGEKQFIAHNTLTNLIETKSSIQIRGNGQRHVMLYKNKMDRLLGINPANAGTISAINYITIEGNYIGQNPDYTSILWPNSINGINIEATNIAIRNNVIDGYRNAIFIGHDYNGVVSGLVDVYHNTVNWRPVSLQSDTAGRIVRIRDINNININNNFITAPTLAEADVLITQGINTNITVANNIISTPNDYVLNPLPNSEADTNAITNYEILSSSNAIDTGGSNIPVFYDANGSLRNIITPDAGAFKYVNTLSLQDNKEILFSVYPNPTLDIFKVQLHTLKKEMQFQLYTINGTQVLSRDLVKTNIFNISFLTSGIYYWQLLQNGHIIKNGKLAKF